MQHAQTFGNKLTQFRTNPQRARKGCKIFFYAKTLIAGTLPAWTFRFLVSSLGLHIAVAPHCLPRNGLRRGSSKFLRAPFWPASSGLRSCELHGSGAADLCRSFVLAAPGARSTMTPRRSCGLAPTWRPGAAPGTWSGPTAKRCGSTCCATF